MNWDEFYKFSSSVNLVIVLLGGLYCNMFTEPGFCFGFLSGSIIMLLNFHIMQKGIRSLFIKEGAFVGSKMAVVFKFYFRLAIIGIIIYILLGKDVDPIGLLLGLSIPTAGIMVTAIYYGIKFQQKK